MKSTYKLKVITIICLVLVCYQFQIKGQTGWFNKDVLNCIVLLEKEDKGQRVPHGTGFLLFDEDKPGEFYVITCEHVLRNKDIYIKIPADKYAIEDLKKINKRGYRFQESIWQIEGHNLIHRYELNENITYVANKELDIGILKITFYASTYDEDSTLRKHSPLKSVAKSLFATKKDINLGDEVYFLGFPFAIGTSISLFGGKYIEDITNPLLRTGSIAYISDNTDEFLLDAFSYAGNSGSPIFTKAGITNRTSKLIGMIVGHLDTPQMENMGLARAVWIDDIIQLLVEYKKIEKTN